MFKKMMVAGLVFGMIGFSNAAEISDKDITQQAKMVVVDKTACDLSEIIFGAMVYTAWNGGSSDDLVEGIRKTFIVNEAAAYPDAYWLAVNYAIKSSDNVVYTLNNNESLQSIEKKIGSRDSVKIQLHAVDTYKQKCMRSIGDSFKIFRWVVKT